MIRRATAGSLYMGSWTQNVREVLRKCTWGDSHVRMTGMLVIAAHQSTRLGLAVPRVLVGDRLKENQF